jgi:hypothetical protein
MHREYLNYLIDMLPLPDAVGRHLDEDYVDFIQTFTIYYGIDEAEEFEKFLTDRDFRSETLREHVCREEIERLWSKTVHTLMHSFVLSRIWDACWGFDRANMLGVPYLAEASIDLESALTLYRLNFLKACMQNLRSVLETSTIHVYLTASRIGYDDLSEKDIRFPPVTRQHDGMLTALVKEKVVDNRHASEIRHLYRRLSESVHSRFSATKVRFAEEDFAEARYRDRYSECLDHIKAVSVACTKLTLCAMRYD